MQRGNALFLILIAVALFAALAYAVTQSGRGGGSTSKELATLTAAQIVQITADMKVGFDRMVLTGTPAQSIVLAAGASCFNECTSGAGCLFSSDGGGVSPPVFPTAAEDHPAAAPGYYPATGIFRCYVGVNDTLTGYAMGVPGIGADVAGAPPNATGTDAIIMVGWIKREVCEAINKGLGISGIPNQALESSAIWDAAPGEHAACITFDNCPDCYQYYHVLNAN
jgi:hypothetical protein